MPAYDRFLDLHLTTQDHRYDFPDDIVAYAVYQRHVKEKNAIGKPALFLLGPVQKWHAVVAQALCRIPGLNARVITDGQTLSNEAPFLLDALRKGRSNAQVQVAVTGTVQKMLARRAAECGLAVVGSGQQPQAGPVLKISSADGGYTFSFNDANWGDVLLISVSATPEASILQGLMSGLQGFGYVTATVSLHQVQQGGDHVTKKLVEWVNTPGLGKLRINAHGDGLGNVYMGPEKVAPADLVKWLRENGLTQIQGLKTLSLFFCNAGMYGVSPSVLRMNESTSTPADGSAIAEVALALREAGLTGVKVTGGNEVTWGVKPAQNMTLEQSSGPQMLEGMAVRTIEIPQGWTFDAQALVLTVPAEWKVEPYAGPGRQALSPVGSGTVAKNQQSGWTFTLEGGKQQIIPEPGWLVDLGKQVVISAQGWTSAPGGKLKFDGTGGIVAVRNEGEGGRITILERLAHSKAKVAMVS